ncbi:MAG: M23 family metallopeptidase [Treponemataceae bacterium]|nr:M23 family metallopeptidase [Treponemataceae bacterium]
MKKTSAKIILFLTAFIFSFNVYAEDFAFKTKNGTVSINVTSKTYPGNVVFIKLAANNVKIENVKTTLIRVGNTKSIANGTCYALKNKPGTYLCILPIDSLIKPGDFNLNITGSFGNVPFEKSFPVSILDKDFLSETLELNETNTAIKTDTSTKRMDQIDRLNKILFSTDKDAQYMSGTFSYPVTSTRRTAYYGDRRVYAYSNGKSSTSVHYGYDYGVPTGTVVSACADGKVVMAEDRISTGWSVVIEHMPGLYSLYYHMSKLEVEVGQSVKQGERLGLSGATGLATGPHLHWEVRLLGTAIDPDIFISTPVY